MGIDVGNSGGIAVINPNAVILLMTRMPETDADLWHVFQTAQTLSVQWACLERVSSSPVMSGKAAFTFGGSYRALRMALTAAEIRFDEVTPFVWQRALKCLSGGDKNVTKQRAQQLFPSAKITHAIADALLLAEYARRVHHDPQAAHREAASLAATQADDIGFDW